MFLCHSRVVIYPSLRWLFLTKFCHEFAVSFTTPLWLFTSHYIFSSYIDISHKWNRLQMKMATACTISASQKSCWLNLLNAQPHVSHTMLCKKFHLAVTVTVRPILSDHCLSVLSVCDVGVLWPNGWMDQDETWHGGRPRPRPYCVRWRTSCPKFSAHVYCGQTGPCLLWTNGWMHQDTTWYGGRPRPRRHCLWLMGSHAAPPRKGPSIFGSCLLWPNGWMDQDATWYEGRSRPVPHFVRRGPSFPERGTATPLPFDPCLLWPRSPISATAELLLQDGGSPLSRFVMCVFRPPTESTWWSLSLCKIWLESA